MRIPMGLVAALALVSGARAQEPRSAGATDWFGRGIVDVRREGTEVQLELRTLAEGMLLRLVEGEPITIVAVGPFAAGPSVVRLPPPMRADRVVSGSARPVSLSEQADSARQAGLDRAACMHQVCVSTTRRAMPAQFPTTDLRAPPREYLLLVLSDQPIDSTVTRRIRTIPGFDPATAAHDLAEYLVGRHSPMWAGYLARR